MKAIGSHPMKTKVYKQLLAQDPQKAEKYVLFVGANPETIQIKWDETKQNFIDASLSSHGMASGA